MPVKKKEGINISIKLGDSKSKAKPKKKLVKKPKSKVITKYLQPQQTGSLGGVSQPVSQTALVRDINTYTEEVNKRNKAMEEKAKELQKELENEKKKLEVDKKREESIKNQLENTKKIREELSSIPEAKQWVDVWDELMKNSGNEPYDYMKHSTNKPENLKPQQTKMGGDDTLYTPDFNSKGDYEHFGKNK